MENKEFKNKNAHLKDNMKTPLGIVLIFLSTLTLGKNATLEERIRDDSDLSQVRKKLYKPPKHFEYICSRQSEQK